MTDTFSYDADSNEFVAERTFDDGRTMSAKIAWNPETTPTVGWDDLVKAAQKTFDEGNTRTGFHRLAKKFSVAGWNLYYGKVKNGDYDEASLTMGLWGYTWPLGRLSL